MKNWKNAPNDRGDDSWSPIIAASSGGHVSVLELLLSKGANIIDVTSIGLTVMSVLRSDKIKFVLQKWPIAMAILIFKELSVYHQTDTSTLIDLYLYIHAEERLLL